MQIENFGYSGYGNVQNQHKIIVHSEASKNHGLDLKKKKKVVTNKILLKD